MIARENAAGRCITLTEEEFGKVANHGAIVYDKHKHRIRGASLDDVNYRKLNKDNKFFCVYFPLGEFELIETDTEWYELGRVG